MEPSTFFNQIQENLPEVIAQETPEGRALWRQLLEFHPADIAQLLSDISRTDAVRLFVKLPRNIRIEVFERLSNTLRIDGLEALDDKGRVEIFNEVSIDDLTDLFDELSNEDLKAYLQLLNAHDRKKVLSLLEFDSDSAGGIMDTDVLSLRQDFTVEKSITVLQRLKPQRDLHQQIYVTDQTNRLVGHINLEDLLLKNPQTRLSTFMQKNELVVNVHQDQELIAKQMIHYNLVTVPVVGDNDYFLGVIPSQTLVDIIEQEANEDVYRLSAMPPITKSYFETSFWRILYERSYILIILLLAQSLSTLIMQRYEVMLTGFLILFTTMLTSTGGNSSSQTSALVIQGMASGEINDTNIRRFMRRELRMAGMMAFILGFFSFARVYFPYGNLLGSLVVSISVGMIVLVSVFLGSGIPILLKRFNFDPAFAAGPFLATIMDILGLLIYCYVGTLFIG